MREHAPATAIAWYLAEDFDQIRALMEDGHKLHLTYAQWKTDAIKREVELREKGVVAYRAVIRPEEFQAWCNAKCIGPDSNARIQFAAEFAQKAYSEGLMPSSNLGA